MPTFAFLDFDPQWDIRCSRESANEIILSWYPPQLPGSIILGYEVSCNLDNYYWMNFTTTSLAHTISAVVGDEFEASVAPVIEDSDGHTRTGDPATTKLIEPAIPSKHKFFFNLNQSESSKYNLGLNSK